MQASRVGGRIRATEFAGTVIEIGPQWLFTGVNPDNESNPVNILHQIANQCGLELRPDQFGARGTVFYNRDGEDIAESLNPVFARYLASTAVAVQLGERLDEIDDPGETVDFSVEAGLRLSGWIPRTPEEQHVEYLSFDFPVAEPTGTVSFRRLFGRDRANRPGTHLVTDQRGYAYLAECIGQEFLNTSRLHLNTPVSAIQYSDECVCATAQENGVTRQYCAPYAIHTFSLGTLQFGTVQFEPPLPESKVFVYNLFNQAIFQKVWISFNETFWDANVDFFYYMDPILGRDYYPVFSPIGASYPGNPPILEAYLSGETSLRVALQDPEITKQQIVDILRRIYGDQVTEPVDIFLHDYATNPYFYGNIDIPLVGVNRQTFVNYAAPVGRLYFSGSGTSAEFLAILQGAYYSGLDTANAILEDIREGERISSSSFVFYRSFYALFSLYLGLPLGAEFINDTPRVVGDSVEAEFITTGGPLASVFCTLRQPGTGFREVEECKLSIALFKGV